MGVFRKSLKAWLISVPALFLLFFVLFPPQSMLEFEDAFGNLIILVLFLGVPLFFAILLCNSVFNREPTEPKPPRSPEERAARKRRAWVLAAIGFVLAGLAALSIQGIIWEVWLIFAFIGGMLGFIAGKVR